MEDEYLDLVDENDRVIGRKLRSEVYTEGLRNFRAVDLFIVNSEGKIWVPRRSSKKKMAPQALDMSMGGHVMSGETYEEALLRETQEELNIDLAQTPYRFLGKVSPYTHDVYCFAQVYELTTEKVPHYNPEDFIEYYWLSPQEIFQRLDKGETALSSLPRLTKLFYLR